MWSVTATKNYQLASKNNCMVYCNKKKNHNILYNIYISHETIRYYFILWKITPLVCCLLLQADVIITRVHQNDGAIG